MHLLLTSHCSFLVVKKVKKHSLFYRRNDSYIDENNFVVVLFFYDVFGIELCIIDFQQIIEKVVDIGLEKIRMKGFLIAEEDFGKGRHDFYTRFGSKEIEDTLSIGSKTKPLHHENRGR
jgi:hypothetical protein